MNKPCIFKFGERLVGEKIVESIKGELLWTAIMDMRLLTGDIEPPFAIDCLGGAELLVKST